jgi:YesN/AraC family two-component response regulator
MSRVEYVGPRVEISNHGIIYKNNKEDKYVYLGVALEILKDIDNDYVKKTSYSHNFGTIKLEEENLQSTLSQYEDKFEECITEECIKYKEKIDHQIAYVQTLPHLSELDKEVWVKNIEIMRKYKMKRALNKMYYMHCIQNIIQVIRHKKIKEIITPFNKSFFHVLNTIKGALITGKPSLDAKVIEEYNEDDTMVLRLSIK